MPHRFILALLAVTLTALPAPRAVAQSAERVPVLLDTDLGSDISDAFALALVLGSDELELRGVTAVGGDTGKRALMLCRFLTMTGRRNTKVAAGAGPQPERPITSQYPYYYHPDVLFNRTTRPDPQSAVDFLYARLKGQPGKLTLLATGPLTNVARLLRDQPDARSLLRQVVLVESNFKYDVPAARAVLAAGVPLRVVSADAAEGLRLRPDEVRKVFSPGTPLTRQVQALYQMGDEQQPPLADVLAAAFCFDENIGDVRPAGDLAITDAGELTFRPGADKSAARVLTRVDRDRFVAWYVSRMAALLPPERTPAQLVERGPMPHRVHVAEDYDTDIERRWWMSGKPETKSLPSGSRRACRGVLTHDFDDLLMHSRQMYTAVIFNPVPGPPMGQHTRLSFRYRLTGTGSLRVQIYSLTNGYHRQLVLRGLPQGQWHEATVDMTRARRPDGTGGPLGEGERIDDIQFYTDPDAELLIDDVVLYDAAAPGERRPSPRHVLFAAGFDTGAQGKEWPGRFDIVPEQGYFWRAARAVPDAVAGGPGLRLGLRGERTLAPRTHLSFRYKLSGADGLGVRLVNTSTEEKLTRELQGLRQGAWAQATAEFAAAPLSDGPRRVDEIHFALPAGAELLVDDVLLYEPGRKGERSER